MFNGKLKTISKLILILFVLFAAFAVTLNILVQNPSIQNYLLEHLGETFGYHFEAKTIKVRLWRGIGFSAHDLVAKPLVGDTRFEAPKFRVVLDITELIQGRILPAGISIYRPHIELAIKKKPKASSGFNNLVLMRMAAGGLPSLRSYSVKQGHMKIEGFPFEMMDVDFTAHPEKRTPNRVMVKIQGRAVTEKIDVPFSLQGAVFSDGTSARGPSADVSLKADEFPLSWIPCPVAVSFSEGTGSIDLKVKVQHSESVSAEGKIFAENVRFSVVRRERRKLYSSEFLDIDIASHYSKKIFEISSLMMTGPDFTLSANSKFDFKDQTNPHIYFCIESPFVPLDTFKRVFPASLIAPWIEERLFPILSEGEARLDHFSMDGLRNQYMALRLPENSDVLAMKVEWKDLEVFKNAGALPFEKVSGELCIEDGSLSTVVTGAVFGNSTITKASLDIDNIYGKHTNSILCRGQFDLQDLWQQEKLCPMPQEVRKKIQAFQAASGELEGYLQISFNDDWSSPRITEGDLMGRNCLFEHEDLVLPLSLDEGKVLIAAGTENRFRGTGHWGKSEFQASGSTDSQWKNAKARIEARLQMNEMMDHFNQGQQFRLEYNDLVPLQATLSRGENAWACHGRLNLDGITLDTDAIHADPQGKDDRVVFDLEFYPHEEMCVNHMKCHMGKSTIEMTGSWDLKNTGGTRLDVSTQGLHLDDLGIRFKKQQVPAKGVIFGDMIIQKQSRDASTLSVTGTAVGKDLSFAMEKMPLPVQNCHFKLDFLKKDAFIRSLGMRMGQSNVNISGQIKGWDGIKGGLDIDVDFLDLTEFIFDHTGPRYATSPLDPFIKKSDIQWNLVVHKGRWKKLLYAPLQAKGFLRSGDFFVKRADARLTHGTFSFKGHVKSADSQEKIHLVCKTQLENQPVDDFLYSLGVDKKALDGPLTLDAWLSTKGNGKKNLISGLQGQAHFQVGKGKLNSPYGLFYKILNVLSLQNIYKGRLPDLSKEAFPFDLMEAHFTGRDGTLETDDFTIKSPVLNLVAPGKIDLNKEYVDIVVWVQTLEAMDSVIKKVPIIGYILTEKECAPKGVLLYPVEAKGHWSDPEVKYSPSMMRLGSGVLNIFKRILSAPGHYFKIISGGEQNVEEQVVFPPDFGEKLDCEVIKDETLENKDE